MSIAFDYSPKISSNALWQTIYIYLQSFPRKKEKFLHIEHIFKYHIDGKMHTDLFRIKVRIPDLLNSVVVWEENVSGVMTFGETEDPEKFFGLYWRTKVMTYTALMDFLRLSWVRKDIRYTPEVFVKFFFPNWHPVLSSSEYR